MALGQRPELLPDARVRAVSNQSRVDVGPGLLGRVIDGAGLPLDGLGRAETSAEWPLAGRLQNPLERARVTEPFDVGVRALRSEEHTSELQSLMRISYAVFCLKKKT